MKSIGCHHRLIDTFSFYHGYLYLHDLFQIFLTSKRYYNELWNNIHELNINIHSHHSSYRSFLFAILPIRCNQIKHLYIENVDIFEIQLLLYDLNQLTQLSLKNVSLSSQYQRQVPLSQHQQQQKHSKQNTIHKCIIDYCITTSLSRILFFIQSYLSNITTIEFKNCCKLNDQELKSILYFLPKLQCLMIEQSLSFSSLNIYILPLSLKYLMIRKCPDFYHIYYDDPSVSSSSSSSLLSSISDDINNSHRNSNNSNNRYNSNMEAIDNDIEPNDDVDDDDDDDDDDLIPTSSSSSSSSTTTTTDTVTSRYPPASAKQIASIEMIDISHTGITKKTLTTLFNINSIRGSVTTLICDYCMKLTGSVSIGATSVTSAGVSGGSGGATGAVADEWTSSGSNKSRHYNFISNTGNKNNNNNNNTSYNSSNNSRSTNNNNNNSTNNNTLNHMYATNNNNNAYNTTSTAQSSSSLKLQHVSLQGCINMTAFSIPNIHVCPHLITLTLTQCLSIQRIYLAVEKLSRLKIGLCVNLKYMNIEECRLLLQQLNVSSKASLMTIDNDDDDDDNKNNNCSSISSSSSGGGSNNNNNNNNNNNSIKNSSISISSSSNKDNNNSRSSNSNSNNSKSNSSSSSSSCSNNNNNNNNSCSNNNSNSSNNHNSSNNNRNNNSCHSLLIDLLHCQHIETLLPEELMMDYHNNNILYHHHHHHHHL